MLLSVQMSAIFRTLTGRISIMCRKMEKTQKTQKTENTEKDGKYLRPSLSFSPLPFLFPSLPFYISSQSSIYMALPWVPGYLGTWGTWAGISWSQLTPTILPTYCPVLSVLTLQTLTITETRDENGGSRKGACPCTWKNRQRGITRRACLVRGKYDTAMAVCNPRELE